MTMGFLCEAAMCWSEENKRRNLTKYPWMRDVTWVKFPTQATRACAWKKLFRRKDKFELTKHSRLCSRHFEVDQIRSDGHASGSSFGMTTVSAVRSEILLLFSEPSIMMDEMTKQTDKTRILRVAIRKPRILIFTGSTHHNRKLDPR